MAAAVVRSLGSTLGKNLREIRLHLCQTSAASKGAREFVEQNYVTLKRSNPEFPILIRECSGVQARLWARYGEPPHAPHHGTLRCVTCVLTCY
uniref:NADH dehydrogenase [ubiquinone] 1 alpha subcomplex subunit 2 n=1 Tax=Astatotilapia calliptera TaxID=8154 RepID=A0AAX7T404_ASTCA